MNTKENPNSTLLKSKIRPFGKWYDNVFGDLKIRHVNYFGILSVSKSDIRNRKITFYKKLISYINTHDNPEAGHYIERAWIAIFHPIKPSRLF